MSPYYEDEMVKLFHGDCLEVLRSLPDNSIDSVVTDPPYGLEFMGKSWDSFKGANDWGRLGDTAPWKERPKGGTDPFQGDRPRFHAGKPFQDWCELWTAECLRVLKPGGHLLAFGGSRTWHRLACAVEDAGFEIRDSIAWLYGCHDDRTEVLTRRGWVNGLDLRDDDDVAQWSTDGTVELVRPTARQRYPFDGRMVRFRNDDVDQLVTPNHRVYHQTSDRVQVNGKRTASWSPWQVRQAADINRWQPMRLPVAGVHDGPGIGGTDYAALLGWVWAEGGFDPTGTGVRVYQSSTNQPFVDEIAALMDRLGAHKRYDYAREWKGNPYTSTTWFVSGELANRVRADLPGKTPTYDLLWRMTADEKRALWDAAMKGDGSKAARTFWQKDRGALEWAQALLASIDCRGKVANDPRGALHWTARPTVELQARHLADASEDYIGEVWCVTVPSGAFIVRRNGRVSVSGNSGFPKSLDVSKAIDKIAHVNDETHRRIALVAEVIRTHREEKGMERAEVSEAVVGTRSGACWNWEHHQLPSVEMWPAIKRVLDIPDKFDGLIEGTREMFIGAEREVIAERRVTDRRGDGTVVGLGHAGNADITAPATAAARQWQGWGTALKPAFEPIVVARKPLTSTVASNVLAHGTGALNIDACRVGTDESLSRPSGNTGFLAGGVGSIEELRALAAEGGKCPDGRDARVALARWEATHGTTRDEPAGRWPTNVLLDDTQSAELDRQSGISKSPAPYVQATKERGEVYNLGSLNDKAGKVSTHHGDSGGASRFFPTFRYEAKAPTEERPKVNGIAHPTVKPLSLISWLVRLVTPPGGTVLDPFAGSGTTAEACVIEGFHCIAIEREADYLPLIKARLTKPLEPVLDLGALP